MRRRFQHCDAPSLYFLVQTSREGLVAIVQEKLVFLVSGQRFAQLLQSPLCSRMLGRIEMNRTSRSNFAGDKHRNDARGAGHGGEETASRDCLGVILQEVEPAGLAIYVAGELACCTWRRCAERAESRASTTVHRRVFLPRLDSQPLDGESSPCFR